MKDFIAVFVLMEYGTQDIKYINKEFAGNGYSYPKPNIEDTKTLISLVQDEFKKDGYEAIDVCSIIATDTAKEVWSDIE